MVEGLLQSRFVGSRRLNAPVVTADCGSKEIDARCASAVVHRVGMERTEKTENGDIHLGARVHQKDAGRLHGGRPQALYRWRTALK